MELKKVYIRASWLRMADDLSPGAQESLIAAIVRYAIKGELPQLEGTLNTLFSVVKGEIEEERKGYESILKRNRENGKKNTSKRGQNNPLGPTGSHWDREKEKKGKITTKPPNSERVRAVKVENNNPMGSNGIEGKSKSAENKQVTPIPMGLNSKSSPLYIYNNNKDIYNKDNIMGEDLGKYTQWVLDNSPRVQKMKQPLTLKQMERLVEKYGEGEVKRILIAMHNWVPLTSKNISANLTAENWLQKDNKINQNKIKDNGKRSITTVAKADNTVYSGPNNYIKKANL